MSGRRFAAAAAGLVLASCQRAQLAPPTQPPTKVTAAAPGLELLAVTPETCRIYGLVRSQLRDVKAYSLVVICPSYGGFTVGVE